MLVSIPFDNPNSEDGSFCFGETGIAEELPAGSSVLFWDAEKQKWNGGMKSAFGWEPAEFHHELRRGEGFCVLNSPEQAAEVVMIGEIPSDETTCLEYRGHPDWSLMANPYPTEVVFKETALAQQLYRGAMVRFWNSGNQRWELFQKGRGGWTTGERVLMPGESFFIQPSASEPDPDEGEPDERAWVVEKPYAFP